MTRSQPIERLRAELARVGTSYAKAGATHYISVTDFGQSVFLSAPLREEPRRSWRGVHGQVLDLLATLPDDAGVDAVWRTLHGVAR